MYMYLFIYLFFRSMLKRFELFWAWLLKKTPWFLVGNGRVDPYSSPLRSPIVVPKP